MPAAAQAANDDAAPASLSTAAVDNDGVQSDEPSSAAERDAAIIARIEARRAEQGTESPAPEQAVRDGETPEPAATETDVPAQILASVTQPTETEPPAVDPAMTALMAQLEAANAKIETLEAKPVDAAPAKDPETRATRTIASRLEAMAREDLGDAPAYLLNEYQESLVLMAESERYLQSDDEGQAAAARKQYDAAANAQRLLLNEAYTLQLKEQIAKVSEPTQATESNDTADERRIQVESLLSADKFEATLSQFPHVVRAINAGAYDVAALIDGIDWSGTWDEINGRANDRMSALDVGFSRVDFGQTAASKNEDPPVEKTPSGVRVADPGRFAARPDEPRVATPRMGPSSAAEQNARIAQRVQARHARNG